MDNKKSWDDIPSLEGLNVESDFILKDPINKRSFLRIADEKICGLFEVNIIPVKIITQKQIYTGRLVDICEGGVSIQFSLLTDENLEENIPVWVDFSLGTVKINSKAVLKHIIQEGKFCTAGIKFIDLSKESAEYISGFFVSINLSKFS